MFATKQTTIVPEIHGEQSSTPINFGGVPNLELESGTTGAPGHIIQQDGGKFDLQFGRSSMSLPVGSTVGFSYVKNSTPFSITNTLSTSGTPSITDGGEILSTTHQGTKGNILLFTIVTMCQETSNHSDRIGYPVFEDSTFIGVGWGNGALSNSNMEPYCFQIWHTLTDSNLHTYSVRAGADGGNLYHMDASTLVFNDDYYGGNGNLGSTMTILEILQ